jgi:hypothetical protein
MNGEITEVAISVAPVGRGRDQRSRQQVVKPARPRIQAQRDGRHGDREQHADQPVAQFDEVRHERLFGAGEFVFCFVLGIGTW